MNDDYDRLATVFFWLPLGVSMVPIFALFVIAAAPLWLPVWAWKRWTRRHDPYRR